MNFEYMFPPVPTEMSGTEVLSTTVTIRCNEPMTILTAKLQGDWTNKDKADVIDAVLEHNHKILFVDRAMAESVLKVEEMDNKIKEVDVAIASLKETEKRITEEAQVTQNTLMDMLDQMVEKGLIEL